MDAAKNRMSKTGMVCGGKRPVGGHFHGVDRFGRTSFPDVDTGFIAWAEKTVPCWFSRPLNEKNLRK